MPMDMAAKPAAPPPVPAPADAPGDDAGVPANGGGNPGADLIAGIDSGLAKLAAALKSTQGVDPAVADQFAKIQAMFGSAVEALMGAQGAPGPMPAQDSGQAAMDAGGNKNAVPVG